MTEQTTCHRVVGESGADEAAGGAGPNEVGRAGPQWVAGWWMCRRLAMAGALLPDTSIPSVAHVTRPWEPQRGPGQVGYMAPPSTATRVLGKLRTQHLIGFWRRAHVPSPRAGGWQCVTGLRHGAMPADFSAHPVLRYRRSNVAMQIGVVRVAGVGVPRFFPMLRTAAGR